MSPFEEIHRKSSEAGLGGLRDVEEETRKFPDIREFKGLHRSFGGLTSLYQRKSCAISASADRKPRLQGR